MKNNIYQNGKDFLIIEFLVALVIIFILFLSGFILIAGKESRQRDVQRLSDLETVKEALFSYYDNYGYYPASNSSWEMINSHQEIDIAKAVVDYNNLSSLLSLYIEQLPADPLNPDNSLATNNFYIYRYIASADAQDFVILFETEKLRDASPVIFGSDR